MKEALSGVIKKTETGIASYSSRITPQHCIKYGIQPMTACVKAILPIAASCLLVYQPANSKPVDEKFHFSCEETFGQANNATTTYIAGVNINREEWVNLLVSSLETSSASNGRLFFGATKVRFYEEIIKVYEYPVKAADPATYCEDRPADNSVHFQMHYTNSGDKPDLSVEGVGFTNLSCFFGTFLNPVSSKKEPLFLCSSEGIFATPQYALIKKMQVLLGQNQSEVCDLFETQGVDQATCLKAMTKFTEKHFEPGMLDSAPLRNNSTSLSDRHR